MIPSRTFTRRKSDRLPLLDHATPMHSSGYAHNLFSKTEPTTFTNVNSGIVETSFIGNVNRDYSKFEEKHLLEAPEPTSGLLKPNAAASKVQMRQTKENALARDSGDVPTSATEISPQTGQPKFAPIVAAIADGINNITGTVANNAISQEAQLLLAEAKATIDNLNAQDILMNQHAADEDNRNAQFAFDKTNNQRSVDSRNAHLSAEMARRNALLAEYSAHVINGATAGQSWQSIATSAFGVVGGIAAMAANLSMGNSAGDFGNGGPHDGIGSRDTSTAVTTFGVLHPAYDRTYHDHKYSAVPPPSEGPPHVDGWWGNAAGNQNHPNAWGAAAYQTKPSPNIGDQPIPPEFADHLTRKLGEALYVSGRSPLANPAYKDLDVGNVLFDDMYIDDETNSRPLFYGKNFEPPRALEQTPGTSKDNTDILYESSV